MINKFVPVWRHSNNNPLDFCQPHRHSMKKKKKKKNTVVLIWCLRFVLFLMIDPQTIITTEIIIITERVTLCASSVNTVSKYFFVMWVVKSISAAHKHFYLLSDKTFISSYNPSLCASYLYLSLFLSFSLSHTHTHTRLRVHTHTHTRTKDASSTKFIKIIEVFSL